MSQTLKQLWRHSSSLIILSRNSTKVNSFNYKVLVLKRPSNGSYPGANVFPGGTTEQADETKDWLEFYRNFGVNDSKLESVIKMTSNRSFIFKCDNNDILHRDISLRITAIRETFEELGVLICKHKEQLNDSSLFSNLVYNNFDVAHWQKQIHKDASNFLKLCEELKVVPDLWSLNEWSVWLTPTFKRDKRFETVFYLVGVNDQPRIKATNNEVERSLWQTPDQLLEHIKTGESWLPPPQIYELSRLRNEQDIDKLLSFAKHRSMNSPTTLLFPVQYQTKDGIVSCYPGDDLYPEQPNYSTTEHDVNQYKDKSCDECRQSASNLHRLEQKSLSDAKIWQNVKLPDNHLSAQTLEQHQSKL